MPREERKVQGKINVMNCTMQLTLRRMLAKYMRNCVSSLIIQ